MRPESRPATYLQRVGIFRTAPMREHNPRTGLPDKSICFLAGHGPDELRALAVSNPTRYAYLPDVPTVAEQGCPKIAVVGWNGYASKESPAIEEKIARKSPNFFTCWEAK